MATRPRKRPPVFDGLKRRIVATLSHDIEAALLLQQKRAPVPRGKAKCPECGVAIDPTRTRKVRTHPNPLTGKECPASKHPWSEYGAKPPRRPRARPAPRSKSKARR